MLKLFLSPGSFRRPGLPEEIQFTGGDLQGVFRDAQVEVRREEEVHGGHAASTVGQTHQPGEFGNRRETEVLGRARQYEITGWLLNRGSSLIGREECLPLRVTF